MVDPDGIHRVAGGDAGRVPAYSVINHRIGYTFDDEVRAVIAYLKWMSAIDTNGFSYGFTPLPRGDLSGDAT